MVKRAISQLQIEVFAKSNWQSLIFDIKGEDIAQCIKNKQWQTFRKELKGKTTKEKLSALRGWLRKRKHSYCAKVQVTNYVNALRRGGLI